MAGVPAAQAAPDERLPLDDELVIPPGAILLGERDELAPAARRAAGLTEQHQGERAEDFGFVGH